MKKILLFVIFLLAGWYPVFSQIKLNIQKPNTQIIKTGVLFERIKLPPANIEDFTGQTSKTIPSSTRWRSFYHAVYQADFVRNLPYFLDLKKQVKPDIKNFVFPVGVINYDYNRIKPELWQTGKVQVERDGIVIPDRKAIEKVHLFAMAPVDSRKLTGNKVTFDFSNRYYFSNLQDPVQFYRIDFDDNTRASRLVYPDQRIQINYGTEGEKHVSVQAVMQSGKVYYGGFDFTVRAIAMPTPDETWSNFQADISYNGSTATGEVGVFFGNGNTDFTRPVIISDGFDPNDTRGLPEIYDIVNQQNMVNVLRSQGYDLVLVNFNAGDDYIQRNAMLLLKVIQTINNRMQVAGTMKPANQIVVVGPSMSGLVSRYALDYMEQHNMQHNVRNWIAFDSPMKGANVPLGVQHWLRFYSDEAGVAGATEALQTLQGPAAKQMLRYHYSATDKNAHQANANSLFTGFYNEINNMGFPQQTRKVAIANGSGYGNGQPYSPGTQTIEYRYRSFLVDLDGDVWAIPNHTDHKIFFGVYDVIGWWNYEEENVYINNTDPLDSAPGGTRDTFQELADTDTDGHGDIIAYYPAHSFIPTISSLCIQNTTDPYYNIDAHINNLQTPFDKLYYPNTNQDHITITNQTLQWLEHEIINYAPQFTSTPVTEIDEESTYSYTLTATDINEWNILNFSVVNMPSWLSYDATTHTFTGTPDYNDIGTHSVTVKVDDGLDESTQTFNIEVFPKCSHAPQNVWNGNAWSNGTPVSSQYVVFNADYDTQSGAVNACSMKVAQGSHLTVTENNPVIVDRDIVNNGEIFVRNNASLVQISDHAQISGSGVFKMQRTLNNLSRYYHIVFWTTPLDGIISYADIVPNAWRYYAFDASNQSWVFHYGQDNIQAGNGYAITAPNGFTGGPFNVMFEKTGHKFNTGIIQVPVSIVGTGAADDNDWNLLGNPYPSAIDFEQFVADNPNIQGSYYAWTNCAGLNGNNNQPSGYSVYSAGGSIAACQNAYTATRYIPSAQGFFVEANAGGQVSFKNGQRVAGNNDNFASRLQNFDRLWLDLTSDNGLFQQTLIGFSPDATDRIDRLYDAKAVDDGNGLNFYSRWKNVNLAIQYLPAFNTDETITVPLGYRLQNNQSQTLSLKLNRFEGNLDQMNIYLHDKLFDIYHDLKTDIYTFDSAEGTFDERFELVITAKTLGVNSQDNLSVKIFNRQDQLVVIAPEKIQNIEIFDTDGKRIVKKTSLHKKTISVDLSAWHHHILICRIQSASGKVFRRKVLF